MVGGDINDKVRDLDGDDVQSHLEDLVFGNDRPLKKSKTAVHTTKQKHVAEPAWKDDDDEDIDSTVDISSVNRLRKLRKTEDEMQISKNDFSRRLRARFEETHKGSTGWADISTDKENVISDNSDSEVDEHLFRQTGKLLGKSVRRLPQGLLRVCRVKDANQHAPSNAVVQAVKFHPNGQILLTAGFDKTLRLFQVDGTENKKIQGIHIPDLPIDSACFSISGKAIYATGHRPYYYSYDIDSGTILKVPRVMAQKQSYLENVKPSLDGQCLAFQSNAGYIVLASTRSNKWIANLKMNGTCKDFVFTHDNNYILSTGSDGDVYKWDLRTRRCVHRHNDEGSLGGTAIAASSSGMYAVGSNNGVVNLYDGSSDVSTPIKSFMHLTTSVSSLKFNHDSQILAMTSKVTKDALKMAHMHSKTVFSNWPTAKTPLHYVSSLDFSSNSGYLACANDKGRVLLYRLNHYTNV